METIGFRRQLAFTRLPMDEVQRIRRETGATVNDVVLTILAGGLRRYLRGVGASVDRPITAVVPVSLRSTEQLGALGNRVSALLVPLAVAGRERDRPARRDAGDHHGAQAGRQLPGNQHPARLPRAGAGAAVRVADASDPAHGRREPDRHQRAGAARGALPGRAPGRIDLPDRADHRRPGPRPGGLLVRGRSPHRTECGRRARFPTSTSCASGSRKPISACG